MTAPGLPAPVPAGAPPARPLALGIGCDRGTPAETIARAVADALALAGASFGDIAAVASITLKANEPGLLAFAARHGWRVHFYSAPELAAVAVPNPSETVRRYTGTPSVSEAAALLAARAPASALAVEKHKCQGPDGKNATVSLARLAVPSPADGFSISNRAAAQADTGQDAMDSIANTATSPGRAHAPHG